MKERIISKSKKVIFLIIFIIIILQTFSMQWLLKRQEAELLKYYGQSQNQLITYLKSSYEEDFFRDVKLMGHWTALYDNVQDLNYQWIQDQVGMVINDSKLADMILIKGYNGYYDFYGNQAGHMAICQSTVYKNLVDKLAETRDYVMIDKNLYLVAGSLITPSHGSQSGGFIIFASQITKNMVFHNFETSPVDVQSHVSKDRLISILEVKDKNHKLLTSLETSTDIEKYHHIYKHVILGNGLIIFMIAILIIVFSNKTLNKFNSILNKTFSHFDKVLKGQDSQPLKETGQYELDRFIYYNNTLMSKLKARMKEIDHLHLEQIALLVGAIESKDTYTRGHSERVKLISRQIGQQLDVDLKTLETAAILHDIGKIHISEAILNKPDKLTIEEFECIKGHAQAGATILSKSKQLTGVSHIILQHHERFDGLGYPSGLSGHDINVYARIIAIADSLDAMTSNRSYRKGMSFEKALTIIADESGKQFDPKIVQVLLDQSDQIKGIIKDPLS